LLNTTIYIINLKPHELVTAQKSVQIDTLPGIKGWPKIPYLLNILSTHYWQQSLDKGSTVYLKDFPPSFLSVYPRKFLEQVLDCRKSLPCYLIWIRLNEASQGTLVCIMLHCIFHIIYVTFSRQKIEANIVSSHGFIMCARMVAMMVQINNWLSCHTQSNKPTLFQRERDPFIPGFLQRSLTSAVWILGVRRIRLMNAVSFPRNIYPETWKCLETLWSRWNYYLHIQSSSSIGIPELGGIEEVLNVSHI
jgi:hypothetical protein